MTTDPIERGAVYCEAWAETAANPTPQEATGCTCGRSYTDDDEHAPWCGSPSPDAARRTQPHYQEPRPDWLLEAVEEHRQAAEELGRLKAERAVLAGRFHRLIWLVCGVVGAAAAGAIVALLEASL